MYSFFVFVTLWVSTVTGYSHNEGFYNIAHMTNNKPSVDWAMKQGANSVELDLQFTKNAIPYRFYHGSPCDCTCMCPLGGCHILYPNSVCVQLEKTSSKPCYVTTDAAELLKHVASKPTMAMVMIDSKLTDGGKTFSTQLLEKAGVEVIKLLEKHLFNKGFKGEVVIGAPNFPTYKYIETISKTTSPYKDRIHFTIDWEDMSATKQMLDFNWNKNIVYNTGLSVCSPKKATLANSKLAAINKANGVFGMTYVWTIDSWKSMSYYINYFNGIITNYPGPLTKLLKQKNIKLATAKDIIPASSKTEVVTNYSEYKCKCSYSRGGCKITTTAPKGLACQCTYPFLWTCEGWVVLCTNQDTKECQEPDLSKASCIQGRGDCGGY